MLLEQRRERIQWTAWCPSVSDLRRSDRVNDLDVLPCHSDQGAEDQDPTLRLPLRPVLWFRCDHSDSLHPVSLQGSEFEQELTVPSLLQPSYEEIGSNTCVGMTGGWAGYAWPPAIAMASAMFVFLLDFAAERYVEKKYGFMHGSTGGERAGGIKNASVDAGMLSYQMAHRPSGLADHHQSHQFLHSADQDGTAPDTKKHDDIETASITTEKEQAAETSFKQQIAAFLILEFGVIFHSVIIGLTLGTAGDEFATLYPVIVFHQTFEGLGIGARLSAIGFPKRLRWMPWMLCTIYGLTTPIAIAIGLGVRHTYNPASDTANIVSGVLDAVSAGILLFTGFVELLARDFLFNPDRTHDDRQLTFMITSVLLGAGLMALLGKKNGSCDKSSVIRLLTSPFQVNGHRLRNNPGNGAATIWSASPMPT